MKEITTRPYESQDEIILRNSMMFDEFHKHNTVQFFEQVGTETIVYEYDNTPVLYLRACKSLRIDVQFVNNKDKKNALIMKTQIDALCQKAKDSGYTEVVFNITNPALEEFAINHMGFEKIDGTEVRRFV